MHVNMILALYSKVIYMCVKIINMQHFICLCEFILTQCCCIFMAYLMYELTMFQIMIHVFCVWSDNCFVVLWDYMNLYLQVNVLVGLWIDHISWISCGFWNPNTTNLGYHVMSATHHILEHIICSMITYVFSNVLPVIVWVSELLVDSFDCNVVAPLGARPRFQPIGPS